jgi:hypothetical protein
MTAFRLTAFAAALVLAGLPAFAQSDKDHDARQMPPGMAGQGMMGMDGGDMMGGGRMMGMMGGPGMMMRMMSAHIEGRLAFLKTELKITEAQASQWTAFADAIRANAKSMTGMHQSMAARGADKTLPERLAFMQSAMTAHLDGLAKTTAALTKLYDVLSAEQKKTADEIVIGPMGMPMGMM